MRKLIMSVAVVVASLMASVQVTAHDFHAGDLRVVHPFTMPTPPAARVGGVFLDLDNRGDESIALVDARSMLSDVVEIHDMEMKDGTMRMFRIEELRVEPGEVIKMRPGGGYHLMLIGLKQPLVEGEHFPLWLTFSDGTELEVEVWVQSMSEGAAAADGHHHHQH